jgi:putative FmdB family regulatory protein
MPAYEYDCMPCGERYVKVRAMTETDPGYRCDKCNRPVVRVYSNIGVTFNGNGFYKTDNRK